MSFSLQLITISIVANSPQLDESVTTASSPDDAKTPESTSLAGFHFHIDENPVAGPVGPHLFQPSDEFSKTELMSPMSPCDYAPNFYSEQREFPVPNQTSQPASWLGETDVESWSPQHVVMWMHQLGFDEDIIEKFFINDISGSILMQLQPEDLKELDVQSFGKRHRLLGCIRQLRNSASASEASDSDVPAEMTAREATSTPQTNVAEVGVNYNESSVSGQEKSDPKSKKGHRHRRHKRHHDVVPEDSVSIVAIEQLLPKRHTCSKGENCAKWQKQQAKLARLAKDLPIESLGGSIHLRGDPGNAASAQSLVKTPKSDVTPSLVASSDALGPNQGPAPHLSENALNNVQPRDPQENVRNFLNFQRLSRLQPANNPPSPPKEFLSPEADSPDSATTNLSENLRHLPKLRIPSTHSSNMGSTLSPNDSAQRTITPSIAQKKHLFAQQAPQPSPAPWSSIYSPGDFYRVDPHYGQATPFSEMDVPITPVPWGPVARDASQSVPPDMRFGGEDEEMADPILRPASTKVGNHRRNPTFQRNQMLPTLDRLDEGEMLRPIETPEDLERTPRAAHCRNNPFSHTSDNANDTTYSGWMKKRKNTRLLRHYWEDHHFTLKGTQLAMHEDEKAAQLDSKALECIDVDDYAVACSSLPSNSKLTAAFKKTLLKRKDDNLGDAAFAFSLIPSPNGTSGQERKIFFMNGPKSHHFAVKTRDERIDWMRELMLAKALRRGRESGASIKVNGGDVL